jgi:hypothetical protein
MRPGVSIIYQAESVVRSNQPFKNRNASGLSRLLSNAPACAKKLIPSLENSGLGDYRRKCIQPDSVA